VWILLNRDVRRRSDSQEKVNPLTLPFHPHRKGRFRLKSRRFSHGLFSERLIVDLPLNGWRQVYPEFFALFSYKNIIDLIYPI
jgi:hypothetical protein